jgi:formate hydrogenlyase subunit 3/multisubunit Na+/H+ antiporter MnhD subunit
MLVLTRTTSTEATVAKKQTRRGVTAMEYLMMISLIVVVCLVAIGYLGTANGNNMGSSSNAINKAVKKGG